MTVPYMAASVRSNPVQAPSLAAIAAELEQALATPCALWNGATGDCVHAIPSQPNADDAWRGAVARVVADLSQVEIIAEEHPLVVLALPLVVDTHPALVATCTFVIGDPTLLGASAAQLLGMEVPAAQAWARSQRIWNLDTLRICADAVARRITAESRARRTAWEVERVSENLAATYEEICLLHDMTNNLRLSQSDADLGQLAIDRLLTCVPAAAAAIQFLPVAEPHDVTYKARVSEDLLTAGDCPIDNMQFDRLIAHLGLTADCGPFVANRDLTGASDWPLPEVQQLILVPLAETEKLFGWLALINHVDGDEFGSVEASLLSSVGAILGIHCGNRDLYRLQDEFLACVVRAMTSAIDAKDPYTCGHSDRVARIAVRLAQQLRCSKDELATIYMAGLLHDVGKIGIDDQVLRKHGKLTTEEFDHIKEHPDLGCKILADLKPLANVLPAVRHHHEQWDGRGYPGKLVADEIPFIARIVAVADAYDAMISDRPYRQGMPIDKVEEIFTKGAGQQWDRVVIDAYFAARDDIREISRRERANLSLDISRWT
jgi:HD-GYP domain-containing protein (c-di-GMP phosphodiesterase class II)